MSARLLLFFPHNPYPPRSGAHQRCLEILTGLRKLGTEVIFLSSTLTSETPWNSFSIQALEANLVKKVLIYEAGSWDLRFIANYVRFNRLIGRTLPLSSAANTPPGMRRWFSQLLKHYQPDLIFMNYFFWDSLLEHTKLKSIPTVVETHDLFTLNTKMRTVTEGCFNYSGTKIDHVSSEILAEDFFEKLQLAPDPEEFKIYDQYRYTIAISQREAEKISNNTHSTQVCLIPVTQALPHQLSNQYTGPALFTTGPNPFNLQGYFYFVQNVLPKILKNDPSFILQVTGACCNQVSPTNGVLLSGFVPTLQPAYESARFLICPVFGGTGQQVKIVEAMAYGVPVIALKAAAEMSPIQHGVNGLVANNSEEFADYAIQLWHDTALCRQFGHAAKETIATEFSMARLLEGLSTLIQL